MDDYKATVRHGIKNVPHVQEVMKMFPGVPTDHFITQYGFEKDKPVQWNTEMFIYGRYIFTYQVDVVVDYQNNRIEKILTNAQFAMREITNVTDYGDNIGARFGSDDKFGEKKWNMVVASKGDFSVIGINLKTNSPVPRFNEFVNATRRDRVQVEP